MKITVTSVSGKGFLNTQADRGSDSGDFLFFTRVSTMNVATSMIKMLDLYFCEWPLSHMRQKSVRSISIAVHGLDQYNGNKENFVLSA